MMITKRELRNIINEELELVLELNPFHKKDGTWSSKSDAEIYSLTKNVKLKPDTDSELEAPARGRVTSGGKVSSKFGMNTGSPEKQCGKLTIGGSKKKKTRSCKDYPENYQEELISEPGEAKEGAPIPTLTTKSQKQSKRPRMAIRVQIHSKKPLTDEKKRPIEKKRRMDKIFPGSDDLSSLARGIIKEQVHDVSLEELVDGLRDLLAKSGPRVATLVGEKLSPLGFYSKDECVKACRRAGYKDLEGWLKFSNLNALAQKGEMFKKEKETK